MTRSGTTKRGGRLPDALRIESGRCERLGDPAGCRLRGWRAEVSVADDQGRQGAGEGEAASPAVAFRRAMDQAIAAVRGVELWRNQ